jgi:hypothetical protein
MPASTIGVKSIWAAGKYPHWQVTGRNQAAKAGHAGIGQATGQGNTPQKGDSNHVDRRPVLKRSKRP